MPNYKVTVCRDVTEVEYIDITIEASDIEDAEQTVLAMAKEENFIWAGARSLPWYTSMPRVDQVEFGNAGTK